MQDRGCASPCNNRPGRRLKATGVWEAGEQKRRDKKSLNRMATRASRTAEDLWPRVLAESRSAFRGRSQGISCLAKAALQGAVTRDAKENPMEVEMKIRGLMMDPVTNMPIVILRDTGGSTVLPIWVGIYEANAIALEIEKVNTPRPMTHDLIRNLLMGLEARVNKVVVNDLRDDTFYALIWLEKGGEIISIDSRPSDALALALRVDCPIYVEEEVLKNSKVSGATSDKVSNEELSKWLESLNDEDIGRYKM